MSVLQQLWPGVCRGGCLSKVKYPVNDKLSFSISPGKAYKKETDTSNIWRKTTALKVGVLEQMLDKKTGSSTISLNLKQYYKTPVLLGYLVLLGNCFYYNSPRTT